MRIASKYVRGLRNVETGEKVGDVYFLELDTGEEIEVGWMNYQEYQPGQKITQDQYDQLMLPKRRRVEREKAYWEGKRAKEAQGRINWFYRAVFVTAFLTFFGIFYILVF